MNRWVSVRINYSDKVDLPGIERVLSLAEWHVESGPLHWILKTTVPPTTWAEMLEPHVNAGAEIHVKEIVAKLAA